MDIRKRIQTFIELGGILRSFAVPTDGRAAHPLTEAAIQAEARNPWFTQKNIRYAINTMGDSMLKGNISKWLLPYADSLDKKGSGGKKIGVVTAGNIPLAGFHDFLSVLISGNTFFGKLSGQDAVLLPAIGGLMTRIDREWEKMIRFIDEPFTEIDAIIATGSDNTYRYFEYYFSKYKHIIRRNRNGIAILNGNETSDDLEGLASDIMLYFGLGCRNVSKIYIPDGYNILQMRPYFEPWEEIIRHNKYFNNYEYQKSIRIVNRKPFYDFGNLLLAEENRFASPVSVLNYERYSDIKSLKKELELQMEKIQCVISIADPGFPCIVPGTSQKPGLWDYADGVDTLHFLIEEIK